MGTKREGIPCYDKAAPDEQLFVLRAQDISSPLVIVEWIKQNIETAPHSKLREALECALTMSCYGRMNQGPGGEGFETKRKKAD